MADDIVTRLQEMLDGPVPFIVGREDIRNALNEIQYLRQICEELMHTIECPNPACTLDWDGIHNWHDYRDQLAGRNKDKP